MQAITIMKPNEETLRKLFPSDPSFLMEKRKQALDAFEKKEMPLFKYGLGVFARLDLDFEKLILKKRAPQFSLSSDVKFFSLEEIKDEVLINKIKDTLGTLLPLQNKIDAYHYAFCDIMVIMNEKDAKLDLSFIVEECIAHHLLIFVKEHTTLHITERIKGEGTRTSKVEIIAEPFSQVHYTTLQMLEKGVHLTTKKAIVKENATVTWKEIVLGGDHVKSTIISDLQGEHAHTNIDSLFFGVQQQMFDMHSIAHHQAPHTHSLITAKGCLDHHAKAISHGLIEITPQAPYSEGSQNESTLLLSDEAESNAIPDLIIHHDEVKCSHAASVGHIDQESLFYLMSRGLTEQEAKKLIVEGFFADSEDEEVQQRIKERL